MNRAGGLYGDVVDGLVPTLGEESSVLLAVVNGKRGTGFTVRATPDVYHKLPKILRQIADDIESQRGTLDVQVEEVHSAHSRRWYEEPQG